MPEYESKYLRDIPIVASQQDPAEATLVAVDDTGADIRIPLRFFSDGRNKVLPLTISGGGNVHVDYRFNDYFYLDHIADILSWSFEGLPGENMGATLALYIKRSDTTKNVVWPDAFKWVGDPPLLSSTPGAIDMVVITTFDSGTTWLADLARSYGS